MYCFSGLNFTLTRLSPKSDGMEALCCWGPEVLRPDLLKNDFQPSGDLLLEDPLRFLLDPGSSMTVWYLAGRFAGPPPAQYSYCNLHYVRKARPPGQELKRTMVEGKQQMF